MLLLYILLAMVGVMVTARAGQRRDRKHTIIGAVGTLLALLAILTGFSIGPFVALGSLLTITFAASGGEEPTITTTEHPGA